MRACPTIRANQTPKYGRGRPHRNDSVMDLSVVIPTYNRRSLLERVVPVLAGQEADGLRYEVVFVINGSTDGSVEFLAEASATWPGTIRSFYIDPTGTPAAPRNRGIREAAGEVVVILDDDVIPDPDLVRRHAEFHREHPEPHHAALGELYVPREAQDDPVTLLHDLFPYDRLRGRDRLSFQDFWTCNISFKRAFMLEHGMFDEDLSYYEDVESGYRLEQAGMHLHFLPAARGQHLHQLALERIPQKARGIGQGLYEFERRVPASVAREIRARHGVLSRDLPPGVLARRLVNRAGFAALANPLVLPVLARLARRSAKRTWATDLYYYVLFRKHMRAGYRAARRGDGNPRQNLSAHSS